MSESDEIYRHMQRQIQQAVVYFGIKPPISADLAESITTVIRKCMSQNTVYFSKMTNDERKERREKIKRDFTGTNYDEVCRKYKISKRTLYRALAAKR